jgi:retinol dehydrogenase-12
MLNAGIMAVLAGTIEQGYEIQFGTYHVGHALLTKLLLPILVKTAKQPSTDVQVISLTSISHTPALGIPFADLKTDINRYLTLNRYAYSKLASILFMRELARRYHSEDITAMAVYPGVMDTNLYKGMFSGTIG